MNKKFKIIIYLLLDMYHHTNDRITRSDRINFYYENHFND